MLENLSESKINLTWPDLVSLIKEFPFLLGDIPFGTHLFEHNIDVGEAQPVWQCFYHMVLHKCEAEFQYMLDNNITKPCSTSWASPCLLVK